MTTRQETVNAILDAYSTWYDIELNCDSTALVAKGYFHEHGAGYIIVQKAQMWSAEKNDFLYIFSVDSLTPEICQDCIRLACDLGEPLIHPDKNHMSSYITAIIICNDADELAIKQIKRLRIRKSFHFSLYGWMEVHAAAVVNRGDIIVSNGDGRRTANFLKNVLHPRKKDLWYKLFNK